MRVFVLIAALCLTACSDRAALCLANACSDRAKELHFPAMPKELADCRVYAVENTAGNRITVMRCPNSTTTTESPSGKSKAYVVVIDGVEYELTPSPVFLERRRSLLTIKSLQRSLIQMFFVNFESIGQSSHRLPVKT